MSLMLHTLREIAKAEEKAKAPGAPQPSVRMKRRSPEEIARDHARLWELIEESKAMVSVSQLAEMIELSPSAIQQHLHEFVRAKQLEVIRYNTRFYYKAMTK